MIGVTVKEVVESAVVLALGADRLVREIKERKAKKRGLSPNPTRCREHEDAIKTLDGKLDDTRLDVAKLGTKMDQAQKDIDYIKNRQV